MQNLRTKLRQRRTERAFERALRTASPAVRQDILAAQNRTMLERL